MAKYNISLDITTAEKEIKELDNIKEQVLELAEGREVSGVALEYVRLGSKAHAMLTVQFINQPEQPDHDHMTDSERDRL